MTVIEGNKDEAFRCIDIAVQAFAEGKLEKAEKFLIKAEKLYPTQKAKGEFKFYVFLLNILNSIIWII